MKACLAEGIEPVGIDQDSEIGGFWRFKENVEHPSVYRSTHIDTDRDINSFGDYPWSPDKSLLIHNEELTRYLKENVQEFDLEKRIRLNTKVEWVTPIGEAASDNKWQVTTSTIDPLSGDTVSTTVEEFDGVMVCSGRHGGGGFIPQIEGLDKFSQNHFVCHSSMYKFPEKHSLIGKRVVVVGVGNSGIDIVTELGPVADECYLVGRSGGWVMESTHMEVAQGGVYIDRLMIDGMSRLPWWRGPGNMMDGGQSTLNRHGMKPVHLRGQQHPVVSGLAGQETLQKQLERGSIRFKRGIVHFTADGVLLRDANGNEEAEVTPIDAVIFATGYRQQAGFVDPKVCAMREYVWHICIETNLPSASIETNLPSAIETNRPLLVPLLSIVMATRACMSTRSLNSLAVFC
jgi:dimethylaniline monooxygenase (N-oxide forming)